MQLGMVRAESQTQAGPSVAEISYQVHGLPHTIILCLGKARAVTSQLDGIELEVLPVLP